MLFGACNVVCDAVLDSEWCGAGGVINHATRFFRRVEILVVVAEIDVFFNLVTAYCTRRTCRNNKNKFLRGGCNIAVVIARKAVYNEERARQVDDYFFVGLVEKYEAGIAAWAPKVINYLAVLVDVRNGIIAVFEGAFHCANLVEGGGARGGKEKNCRAN